MAKLREGQKVVFTFKGRNQLGVIENVRMINKLKRYQVRAESGQLYPYLGVNTVEPGKINLPLTEMYYSNDEDPDVQDGVAIGSEGDVSESTK